MSYQKVKGTLDFTEDNARKYRYIESLISEIVQKYGFEEIITPIIENTDVFVRSSGEESDIVSKEMYTFLDRGERSITLRPEGTAGAVRSFLENKMYATSPVSKLYYFGPMFRYERPQAGRYRQFTQFGVEVFGAVSPLLDADVILSAYAIFKKLAIGNVKLKINSIGDFATREQYQKILYDYFKPQISSLCDDCKRRLEKNPMRILDCKVDMENPVLKNAPKISQSLSPESKDYFREVLAALEYFQIPYETDDNLVRGLDYYTDTVFEFIIAEDEELGGLAICAGGRYSQMVSSFGGPDIPGIGYAFGVERIMALMEAKHLFPDLSKAADAVIIALDPESKRAGLKLAGNLREAGYYIEMDYTNTSMKQQFKLSDRVRAKLLIIIGEEERMNSRYTIKNNNTKKQETVESEKLIEYIKENLQ